MDLDVNGDRGHLFHLVLYANADASDSLVRLLTEALLMPEETALHRLADLATKGRAILMTCERAQADLVRGQLESLHSNSGDLPTLRLAVERVWARPN